MRIAVALVMAASALWSCTDEVEKGKIVVRLTDSPGDYEAINVEIRDVQVKASIDNGEEGWVSLPAINKGVYNLLDLTDGRETVLTNSEYPTGRISQIRLILGENNSVMMNGESFALKTPSAQHSGLKLLLNADLLNGITYSILLDFDAAKSVIDTGNKNFVLKPVVKVVSEALDGAIEGKILPAETTVAVFAISGADTLASSYVPMGAKDFFLGGLPNGSFKIAFDPGASSAFRSKTVEGINVGLGAVTDIGDHQLELKE